MNESHPVPWMPGVDSVGDAWLILLFLLLMVVGFVFLTGRVWRKYTLRGRVFFALALCSLGLMGLSNVIATKPSSAPRITTTGYCTKMTKEGQRSNIFWTFELIQANGLILHLETSMIPPGNAGYEPLVEDGQELAVTYLDERPPDHYLRAIEMTVLSGPYTGWHKSVNANWFGPWILGPFGIVSALVFIAFTIRNRAGNST